MGVQVAQGPLMLFWDHIISRKLLELLALSRNVFFR